VEVKAAATGRGDVIDTHVFAISPYFLRQNFLPPDIDATLDALVEDMDAAGVAKAIATMFVTHEDDIVGSVPAGVGRNRERVAAQLHLQPNRPEWSAANIKAAADTPAVVGGRAMLSVFRLRPDDPRLDPMFEAAERARLPVQLVFDASTFSHPDAFDALARAHPELPLVLSVARARNRAALKSLLRHPRVFAQLPGLLENEVTGRHPEMLLWAARHLPPEKLMFGSDRLGREPDYAARVRCLDQLDGAVRAWVARDTALSVYGERLARAAKARP
jgi:predicted TIM-barrel fold metal-dependent hydrolase